MNHRFAFHAWRRDMGNFAPFKYRDFQGFIVSGQNSGTQWLKYMLSLAIAERYDLPPPEHANNDDSNDFIGHPKHPRLYSQTPRIASTHTIPHPWAGSRLVRRCLPFPPYVILVRDIRAALVSHYEKWREEYGISFSEFIEGDVDGGRHWADLWWHIRFCNRWGGIIRRFPDETLLLHYEDLQRDATAELARIRDFFDLDLADEDLAFAVRESSKEKMATRINPELSGGYAKFVRIDGRDPLTWYSDVDIGRFQEIARNNLRHAMGYDYAAWRPIVDSADTGDADRDLASG